MRRGFNVDTYVADPDAYNKDRELALKAAQRMLGRPTKSVPVGLYARQAQQTKPEDGPNEETVTKEELKDEAVDTRETEQIEATTNPVPEEISRLQGLYREAQTRRQKQEEALLKRKVYTSL